MVLLKMRIPSKENIRFVSHCRRLVRHLWLQFLGLVDHLLHFAHGGYTTADVELGVNLFQFRLQVLCYTVTELLDGIDASLLEQLRELRAYAIDTEQVGMIGPAEDQFLAAACGLSQFLTALGGCTLLEQFTHFVDTGGNQFLCINVAYTLDVDNLVIHNLLFLMIHKMILAAKI